MTQFIPHQAWLAFVALVTRVRMGTEPLLAPADAHGSPRLGDAHLGAAN
jgi:hypothetical protein